MSITFNRSAPRTTSHIAVRTPSVQRSVQPLTFAPLAWLKLQHFLQADDVEIAGFGISSPDHLLYIESFQTLRQHASFAHVELDDQAVADHFDTCIDQGIPPHRCGRIWIHTHPGHCPMPSTTDEATFERVFGNCDWAIMLIIARDGSTYARLQFNAGPGGSTALPVHIDWARFPDDLLNLEGQLDTLISGWSDEYGRNIHPAQDDMDQLADWAESVHLPVARFRRDYLAVFDNFTLPEEEDECIPTWF